jgi:hypothetical protein
LNPLLQNDGAREVDTTQTPPKTEHVPFDIDRLTAPPPAPKGLPPGFGQGLLVALVVALIVLLAIKLAVRAGYIP